MYLVVVVVAESVAAVTVAVSWQWLSRDPCQYQSIDNIIFSTNVVTECSSHLNRPHQASIVPCESGLLWWRRTNMAIETKGKERNRDKCQEGSAFNLGYDITACG